MSATFFDDVIAKDAEAGDVHVSTTGGGKGKKRKWNAQTFTEAMAKFARPRALRMIDNDHASSPFPYDEGALGALRPDQVPRFLGAVTDPGALETRNIPHKDLTAMQNRVHAGKVEAIMGSDQTGKPPVVVRNAGRMYIADGHHRLAADHMNGKTSSLCAFKDITSVDNAVKAFNPDQARDQNGRFAGGSASENDHRGISDRISSKVLTAVVAGSIAAHHAAEFLPALAAGNATAESAATVAKNIIQSVADALGISAASALVSRGTRNVLDRALSGGVGHEFAKSTEGLGLPDAINAALDAFVKSIHASGADAALTTECVRAVNFERQNALSNVTKGFSPDQPRGPDGKFIPKGGGDESAHAEEHHGLPRATEHSLQPHVAKPRTSRELAMVTAKQLGLAVGATAAAALVIGLAPETAAGAVLVAGAHYVNHAATALLVGAATTTIEHILNHVGVPTAGVRDFISTMVNEYHEVIGKAQPRDLRALPPDVLAQVREFVPVAINEANAKAIAILRMHGPGHEAQIAQIEKELNDKRVAFLAKFDEATTPLVKSAPRAIQIAKMDPEKQMVFGWASVVEQDGQTVIDKQDDKIASDTMENAVYDFMLTGGTHGHMHETIGTGRPVESMYFSKEKQDALGINLNKVGWWVGFKVDDPEVWKRHKAGELPEFSIGGQADRELE